MLAPNFARLKMAMLTSRSWFSSRNSKVGTLNCFREGRTEADFPLSVVAVSNIEQIKEFPSLFMTNGQQMVESPIVAASKGTGIIYKTCR